MIRCTIDSPMPVPSKLPAGNAGAERRRTASSAVAHVETHAVVAHVIDARAPWCSTPTLDPRRVPAGRELERVRQQVDQTCSSSAGPHSSPATRRPRPHPPVAEPLLEPLHDLQRQLAHRHRHAMQRLTAEAREVQQIVRSAEFMRPAPCAIRSSISRPASGTLAPNSARNISQKPSTARSGSRRSWETE